MFITLTAVKQTDLQRAVPRHRLLWCTVLETSLQQICTKSLQNLLLWVQFQVKHLVHLCSNPANMLPSVGRRFSVRSRLCNTGKTDIILMKIVFATEAQHLMEVKMICSLLPKVKWTLQTTSDGHLWQHPSNDKRLRIRQHSRRQTDADTVLKPMSNWQQNVYI